MSSPSTFARPSTPPRLILRHLSVPPEVIDLLLFLHACARLHILGAHGLTQPIHMLRGVWQGNPEYPLLYVLFLEPLLRAHGHRLRLPGEAKQGHIQAYIDDTLVVAHTLQHFVEGVEAVATYLGMMGMELNPRKCVMATTEGVPGLQLRLCPHLESPLHWGPRRTPSPTWDPSCSPLFPPQRKYRLRLAAVHHWRLNTLASAKVVQDVILLILGGVTQYVTACIADDCDTARHLDHIRVQAANDRAGAYAGANAVPAGSGGPRGHARPRPLSLRAHQGHKDVLGNTRCARHMPRDTLHRPGIHDPGRGRLGPPHTPGPGRPGSGALQLLHVPHGSPSRTTVPPGNIITLRTAKLRHRDTCCLTVPHTTRWNGPHRRHHPFPDNDDPWPAAVQERLSQCANEHLHYCRCEQEPTDHSWWRDALVHLFHTTSTRDPRLQLEKDVLELCPRYFNVFLQVL